MKAAARAAALAARAAAHARGQGAAADHLASWLAPHAGKVLAGYLPIRTEIDPRPAMAAHSGPVCVPVVEGAGQPLRFRSWTQDAALERGLFGTLNPAAGDWQVPDIVIVPLVAFDAKGFRLGYGGGFYDRTLERLRAKGPVLAVGFAFAAQELPAVPMEPTDQPLDAIVTERGLTVF
ncbi:5-formyltetrahydrofolate cyclo-ligase [Falsirhodobacter sp. 20TX0035]|uniref:5-formyltetrahydrofolate cyclo-ligase n=1 Tax=Falsirhodobacter sp. 20TX0035 TaxID=3022019 RepID=UPI00232A8731|nr:5-formyltetrahydrofolate cyclo-ligase [Falsirhodobacter sp. 20TX0035]MDB6454919.1 5-formyltetrahydrofolate cyclo-ligase [Falsirhodobacter sp. 20TX0035]